MTAAREGTAGIYAWSVFALTFALMLSDFASRTIITAILPLLKAEWQLTDAQLGSLVSVIALVVGVMSLPISLLADRWGRVRSVTLMAVVWGLATMACGLAGGFASLLLARAVIGLGEAGYGSCGGAILMQVFPARTRSTIAGAVLAAALFGSVLGVALGGIFAAHLGWRGAFVVGGALGLVLAVAYGAVVRESHPAARRSVEAAQRAAGLQPLLSALFEKRSAVGAYVGFGFQSFTLLSVTAWLPTFLHRYYAMSPGEAGVKTGMLILVSGVGMVVCGRLVDRFGKGGRRNKLHFAAAYALASCALLVGAFSLSPGLAQIALLGAGLFLAGGTSGPTVAVVTDVIDPAIHATALALVALFSSLLGQAPGPFVTGIAADLVGLRAALEFVPLASLAATAAFAWGARSYEREIAPYVATLADDAFPAFTK